MKTYRHKNSAGEVTGYRLCLSREDTREWARRPGTSWPCSGCSGKALSVIVDGNGLCDIAVNGRDSGDIEGHELDAIVADHLAKDCRHLWPVWGGHAD